MASDSVSRVALLQPDFFGMDLALKIMWALLDLLTILVLISGLYLWFSVAAPRRA